MGSHMIFSRREQRVAEIILAALDGVDQHGYTLTKRIRKHSDALLPHGDSEVYAIVRGLENEDCLEAYIRQEADMPRYYYRLTDRGHKRLKKIRAKHAAAPRDYPFALQPKESNT